MLGHLVGGVLRGVPRSGSRCASGSSSLPGAGTGPCDAAAPRARLGANSSAMNRDREVREPPLKWRRKASIVSEGVIRPNAASAIKRPSASSPSPALMKNSRSRAIRTKARPERGAGALFPTLPPSASSAARSRPFRRAKAASTW